MTVNMILINQSMQLSTPDLADLRWGMQAFARGLASRWNLEPWVNVRALVPFSPPLPGDWKFYIVDTMPPFIPAGVLGYHMQDGAGGVIGFVSAAATLGHTAGTPPQSPFGTIYPAVQAVGDAPAIPEKLIPGSLSEVLAHEIAEALIDPCDNRFVMDPAGMLWMLEICDHADAYRRTITVGTRQVRMIVPDYTLPSFYDPHGLPPYSFTGQVSARFTLDPGCYAYKVLAGVGSMVGLS